MSKPGPAAEPQSARKPRSEQRSGKLDAAPAAALAPAVLPGILELPDLASPGDVLSLQRASGNRAVQRWLGQRGVQAKLTVGPAGDRYEQEAERVADQVMQAPVSSPPASAQRQAGPEEEETLQRTVAITPLVQRHSVPAAKAPEELKEDEEEQQVQRQPAAGSGAGFEAGRQFESELSAAQGSGSGLPDGVRTDMEARFGADFGHVRVHTDAASGQLNRQISAQAFTHGSHIYFGAGNYEPGTGAGRHLLAHELTHVVQQTGNTVRRAGKKKGNESYNIRAGAKLPDTKEMAKNRMKIVLGYDDSQMQTGFKARLLTDAQAKIDNDEFVTEIVEKVLTQFKKESAVEPLMQALRDTFARFADPRKSFDEILGEMKEVLKINTGDGLAGVRVGIANTFKVEVEKFSKTQVRENTPGLRREQRFVRPGGDHSSATDVFWQSRQAVSMVDTVPPEDVPTFAAALKEMPTVKFLLTPKNERKPARPDGGWKGGGRLEDTIKPVNDLVAIKKWMGPKRTNSKTFRRRLNQVDDMVRMTVEPEFLASIPKPTINIHATAAQGWLAPWGYRANAGSGKVDVSYDEATNVIAHEVGHILEEYLPMKRWHDIHLLLGSRHRAAGGGETAVTGDGGSKSEGRYAGKYLTGKYTSTAYKGDNAEVVSMAMQFLARPQDALKLINGDPQHAAIVLRGFRPQEYRTTVTLRPFDKYLPNKKKVEKPKEKTKEERESEQAFELVKAFFEQYQGFTLDQMLTLGEISGFHLLKALSVKGEELQRRIQALMAANSSVTREEMQYYED